MGSPSLVSGTQVDCRTLGTGSCKTRNIIYMARCILCPRARNSIYVGRTSNELRSRINGHRSMFYGLLRVASGDGVAAATGVESIVVDDKNCLGAHLIQAHGARQNCDFDQSYKFIILKNVDPLHIISFEQRFIEVLNCRAPGGLNAINSRS